MKKHILGFILVGALVVPATSKSATPKIDYSSWIVPTLFTAGAAYAIWSSWDNSRSILPSRKKHEGVTHVIKRYESAIPVGLMEDDDAGEVVEDTVSLQQLPVSQQGHHNDGGASCGYHSLKNAIGIIAGELSYLTDTQIIADHFSLTPGSWRASIQERLAAFGVDALQADWLSVDAFEGLVTDILPTPNYSLVDADGKSCKGYDNAWNVDELGRVAQVVRRNNGQEYKHVFFINTARLAELQGNRDTFAHWYVLVMDKQADGLATYTVMDSLGIKRCKDATVLKIINKIHY